MSEGQSETIFALATAPGKAGLAVVRVSGPLAHEICLSLTGGNPVARQASVRVLRSTGGDFLDEALVLLFEDGASFTGEKTCELHLHGSIAVIRAVQTELSKLGGRLAEPGEFTRRAMENGRIDLSQVEGLADLIESETEAQRRQALRSFSGELGAVVETWRSQILRSAALLEATIDFVEEDVPVDVVPEVKELLVSAVKTMRETIDGFEVSERIRSGFEVAIIGAPNSGKSTLLNRIAGREAAIVSEVAGTTRDVIEVRMDLKGLPVVLLDTAGLRETSDKVEKIGVDRAKSRAEQADIRIFLGEQDWEYGPALMEGDLLVEAKADLREDGCGVSGKTGLGLNKLLDDIFRVLEARTLSASLVTRERHRTALEKAIAALSESMVLLEQGPEAFDLAVEEIRLAARRLDSLVGRLDVEMVLDEIFSSFCIGK